MTYLKLTRSIC